MRGRPTYDQLHDVHGDRKLYHLALLSEQIGDSDRCHGTDARQIECQTPPAKRPPDMTGAFPQPASIRIEHFQRDWIPRLTARQVCSGVCFSASKLLASHAPCLGFRRWLHQLRAVHRIVSFNCAITRAFLALTPLCRNAEKAPSPLAAPGT